MAVDISADSRMEIEEEKGAIALYLYPLFHTIYHIMQYFL